MTPPPPNGGTETPTPLTDAAKCRMNICMTSVELDGVPADFARTLERRVNRLKGLLERTRATIEYHAQFEAINKDKPAYKNLLADIDAEGKE